MDSEINVEMEKMTIEEPSDMSMDDSGPVEEQHTEYTYQDIFDYSSNLNSSFEPDSDDNIIMTATEHEKCIIRKARHDFEVFTIEKKAPFFIPTLFLNNDNREEYVKERDRICPKKLPTNRVDAYDLFCVVNQDINNSFNREFFLKHSRLCEIVHLKKEFSPELAFEEVLMSRPFFYSKNVDVKKKSKYISSLNGEALVLYGCGLLTSYGCFIVEFCVIYPEDKFSTAIVSCAECGRFTETVLDKSTTVVVKKEIMKFSMSSDIKSDELNQFRAVLPLPDDMIKKNPLEQTFVEGVVGFTPVTGGSPFDPSVFVRVRIKYATNGSCVVQRAIHGCIGEELYPDYIDKYSL